MKYELNKDDDAVLDYVSGLRESLGAPQGEPSVDRERAGELKAMAGQISALQIEEPAMGVKFADVLAKANLPKARGAGAMVDRWVSGWRLMAASILAVGLIVATFAAVEQISATTAMKSKKTELAGEFSLPDAVAGNSDHRPAPPEPNTHARYAGMADEKYTEDPSADSPSGLGHGGNAARDVSRPTQGANIPLDTLMRSGTLGLRDENPAAIQRKITDALLLAGGMITSLAREGTGKDTVVRIDLAVPADKYQKFVLDISAYGEVVAQTEQAVDAGNEIINNDAALAEAQDYLKRIEALIERGSNNLSEMQRLEAERRGANREVERLKRIIAAVKDRVAMARLSVTISAIAPQKQVVEPKGEFEQAWEDGTTALVKFSAFLLKALLAALPVLIAVTAAVIVIRRVRRSRME